MGALRVETRWRVSTKGEGGELKVKTVDIRASGIGYRDIKAALSSPFAGATR